MKKIMTIALLMLLSVGANAQKEVFQKYKGMEGVTTLHVPKFLMRLAGRASKEAQTLTDRVSHIRVLSCEEESLAKKIKADALAAYKRGGYEEMIRINEDGQRVVIYQRILKSGKNEYAILAVDDELAIVNVVGRLSLEELDQVNDMID